MASFIKYLKMSIVILCAYRSIFSTPPPSDSDDSEEVISLSKKSVKSKDNASDSKWTKESNLPWETSLFDDEPPPSSPENDTKTDDIMPYSPLGFNVKPAKDKHNKLRETIEKLKAKSEINRLQTPTNDFEGDDHLKENKDKNKKSDERHKNHHKERSKEKDKNTHNNKSSKKNHQDSETDSNKIKKKDHHSLITKPTETQPVVAPKASQPNMEALSLATEQTLKDINKWLDDTPKFGDFSSASNSPSYFDDFDLLGTPRPMETKKMDRSITSTTPSSTHHSMKRDGLAFSSKDILKKKQGHPFKLNNKRREPQRTIDRLQPGKSKGNLITNVQKDPKPDEIFPLGPLSKLKDTKNSLIVKTDTNAPKLSLGSVLDSFGKHQFAVDDQKKEEEEDKTVDSSNDVKTETEQKTEEVKDDSKEVKEDIACTVEKVVEEPKVTEEVKGGGPTPNLSAWFKAFGAPKTPAPQKKSDKAEAKDEEIIPTGSKSERVPPGDPSPRLESPHPQGRQRRTSTGSSMSERSSFSQDLDSPRVGMEERGSYPAPYPSPLHRSPTSGASPVMASPHPEVSPRSAYPFNGGQMRVGFYQDTAASSKSSPDKSCSPRENARNSPFYQPSGTEQFYAPNTVQAGYSASYPTNSNYYNQQPSYSSSNPTPPYNTDGSSNSYYDTSKIVEHYQSKPQGYPGSSPVSSQPSPAPQPLSPHSPHVVHHPQTSPSVHSPSIHSPNVQSPSMHSPSLHSPSIHSPSMHSSQHSHSPQLPSPGQSLHSPGLSIVSPQVMNSPSVQNSPMALNSPNMVVNSPINPASVESFPVPVDDTSSGNGDKVTPKSKEQDVSQQTASPVKKRAFIESELPSQFVSLQEEMVNRNLQMGHQLSLSASRVSNQDAQQHMMHHEQLQQQIQKQQMQKAQEQLIQAAHQQGYHKQEDLKAAQEQFLQKQQQQQVQKQQEILQKQQLQEVQEHLLQQAHLQQQLLQQQQKSQQLMQQEQQKAQQLYKEQQKQQQQIMQEQKQQAMIQQQKNLQLLQQQAMAAFNKNTVSDQSLRTPSPSSVGQQSVISNQQHSQRSQQQIAAHSNSEASARVMSYPVSTTAQSFNLNATSKEAYPLNVARSIPSPQQKLDMSKFTNMGYTGPEVNFSRALQQQYGRPDLSYTRTTAQSAISQASQLLNSQALITSQPSASSTSSLPGYQKTATTQQQAHSATYQTNRSVDSVAERLAAQVQQEAAGFKQDSRASYNSATLDLEQALGLGRNFPNIVDRYSNEQRMMAGLQSAANSYYSDKALGSSQIFNKQLFNQNNMAAMGYSQQQQQTVQQQNQSSAQSIYGRQMAAELQAQPNTQDRKRKKKSSSKGSSSETSSPASTVPTPPGQSSVSQQHGFQSYAGLKGAPAAPGATSLDPAIALKSSSVPGSAFNFGSGALGMPSGLPDSYSNLLEDFRGTQNYFMSGANPKPGQSSQGYPPFLNPAAHQSRSTAYPLGGPFMDTSSPLYQHYLQAGVLNQGLLGPTAGGYPPGYHAALTMRQPYDSMSRPSWL